MTDEAFGPIDNTDYKRKAEAAEGLLGFVLQALDRPVFITAETLTEGFTPGVGIYVDTSEDGIEVGLRSDS